MNIPSKIEKIDADKANPVTSFEAGVITRDGEKIGVCLKFAMYDHTTKITHWYFEQFKDLMGSLKTYLEHLGNNAFMIRAHFNPSLVEDLADRHPYNTLTSEVPALTEEEIGTASMSTGILTAAFVIRGPTFEMKLNFADGMREKVSFHEYTALSMYAYLDDYMKAFDQLSGPAGGNA